MRLKLIKIYFFNIQNIMAAIPENIYPQFDSMLSKEEKENLLKQRGYVIWLYGLSGSGKSTLAVALEQRLKAERFLTQILDGDNIRSGLNSNLAFTVEDREENIRRIAEVAKLFLNAGIVTLTAFITPKIKFRDLAKKIIGPQNFYEVYVKCPFNVCAARDVKGLYAKAEEGQVKDFTGRDSVFEEPINSDLTIDTENCSPEESLKTLYSAIVPHIFYNHRI